MARELRSMTVGIIGCGCIGVTTLRCLSGFGVKKLYASDPFEREDVRQFADYASPETLYRECDIILFHAAATPENYHMINDAAIASMKKEILLVNCAHGSVRKGARTLIEARPFRWRSGPGSDILKTNWVFR